MNLESLRDMPITVLLGGSSPERDVSLQSGATVANCVARTGRKGDGSRSF